MGNREYRPTLAQLRTFVTIAEHKHFGTAAHKLNISQPSLSQALVTLESGLGIQLIERSTRKVIVTPVGQELLPLAKATLDAADAFAARSRGALGVLSGALNIGVIPTLTPYILPEFLKLSCDHFPDLKPQVVEDRTAALLDRLRDGAIDVAVVALPTSQAGFDEQQLFTERLVAVTPASHPLAGRKNLTADELGELDAELAHPCRVEHAHTPTSAAFSVRASSLATIMHLVAEGLTATVLPESAVASECIRPGLSVATFDESVGAVRTIGLISRPSSSRSVEYRALGELISLAHSRVIERGKQLIGG
ncbi:LysR family transcriptional regulator [Corynebacterium liangguodongii]|uniref:Probable hydrogen peroxide-inducible genes activator n=1 Tax=Corynebacterium liangguodongii TaxID=2079535 RepID=A0A2S0WEI3_9CORY|nr:hydrogen peroxide-inducible genes activator [Corynebacterium liangguodongii]AWB84160.1 LysR family transcriptional regulator [Corynebacterium liangguodongii]PWC00171.1 hydrogen peroxide-inducible genes activator [Corynebacterium liangguodongii]